MQDSQVLDPVLLEDICALRLHGDDDVVADMEVREDVEVQDIQDIHH